jgi:tetratricopeptide (TPR) repeat protein
MKTWAAVLLALGIAVGALAYLTRPRTVPSAPAQAAVEPAADRVNEPPPPPEPSPAPVAAPAVAVAQPRSMPPAPARPIKPAVETELLRQQIEALVSPQVAYDQKQAIWGQLAKAGKLDPVISDLESRMAANPRAPEYPAALGQAYLQKCATLQDVREQGILGMQADKVFDTALNLDPSNWEARFTKAVALSYWPPMMNKGEEVIQHFTALIQQQEAQPPQPHFAETYVWLGDQYQKAGQTDDARAVWTRGASLFPDNQGLQKKLAVASTAQASSASAAR